jgi:hypothetical protein
LAVGHNRPVQELGLAERDLIEMARAQLVAEEIITRLPTSKQKQKRRLTSGSEVVQQMSWDIVVQNFLLPALVRAAST